MSEDISIVGQQKRETVKNIRLAMGIAGVLAIVFGAAMLLWPGKTAIVLAVLIGVYALISGVIYVVVSIGSPFLRGWSRFLHVVVGILFVVAGIIALANPASSALSLGIVVTVFVAVSWIFEGFAAFATLEAAHSKGWTIFAGVIGILAGVSLLFAPLAGLAVLWIWLAVATIAIGVFQLVRAIRG